MSPQVGRMAYLQNLENTINGNIGANTILSVKMKAIHLAILILEWVAILIISILTF